MLNIHEATTTIVPEFGGHLVDQPQLTCWGCHIQYLHCAPLVGSLDMDYWCSAFETKGARVNTGYGTPNMF